METYVQQAEAESSRWSALHRTNRNSRRWRIKNLPTWWIDVQCPVWRAPLNRWNLAPAPLAPWNPHWFSIHLNQSGLRLAPNLSPHPKPNQNWHTFINPLQSLEVSKLTGKLKLSPSVSLCPYQSCSETSRPQTSFSATSCQTEKQQNK